MDTDRVSKIKKTLHRLRALLAEDSGATTNEKEIARKKIRVLEAELAEHIKNCFRDNPPNSKDYQQFFGTEERKKANEQQIWEAFFAGFNEDIHSSKMTKEYFEEFKKAAQQKRAEDVQQAREDLFDDSEEKSRAFLGGIDIKEIKFYQGENGLYIISQMTIEFLNKEIAFLARLIAALEKDIFANQNDYKIRSAKLMKSRLKIERDSKNSGTDKKQWRFKP